MYERRNFHVKLNLMVRNKFGLKSQNSKVNLLVIKTDFERLEISFKAYKLSTWKMNISFLFKGGNITKQEARENFVFPDEIKTKLMKMSKLMNIFYVP